MILYGSYRVFQRYLYKNQDMTFDNQTGMVFEHLEVTLKNGFSPEYLYLHPLQPDQSSYNTSAVIADSLRGSHPGCP